MAGSGKHPGKEALKNKAMLVVRNVTKQEVTNVIFPNGLTVGTADLKNGAKIHGNAQVAGIVNAQGLRINGSPITGTEGPRGLTGAGIFLSPPTVVLPADYNGNVDSDDFALGDTSISTILGAEILPPDNTSPFSDNTFRVGTPTGTGITPGTATHGSLDVTFSSPSSMTADTASITYPVVLNISGSEATVNIEQNFVKAKEPVPTPIVSLDTSLLAIPTDFLGRNPDDGVYFDHALDFPSNVRVAHLSSMAGTTSLTWYGDEDDSTPTNPPEGQFRINPMGITGTTSNGVTLTPRNHGDLDSSPGTDKAFSINFANQESVEGHVLRVRFEGASGGVNIRLHRLAEFDNSTSGDFTTGGTQRFDSISLTIPVIVTLGGETTTINKVLTIQKVKEAPPNPIVTLTNENITVATDSTGGRPDGSGSFLANSHFGSSPETVLKVVAGGEDLTWYGEEDDSTPTNPPEGQFRINPMGITGVTENGTVVSATAHGVTLDTPSATDKDFGIQFVNDESSPGRLTRILFTASGTGVQLQLDTLAQYDNTTGSSHSTGGSQEYNTIEFTIPVMVTLGGSTSTINKTLKITKNRPGESGRDGDNGTDGTEPFEVYIDPSNATVSVNSQGSIIDASTSAARIGVRTGNTDFLVDDTSPYGNDPLTFRVTSAGKSASLSEITQTDGDTYATVSAITSMSTDNVYRTFGVSVVTGSAETLHVVTQNISKSYQSAPRMEIVDFDGTGRTLTLNKGYSYTTSLPYADDFTGTGSSPTGGFALYVDGVQKAGTVSTLTQDKFTISSVTIEDVNTGTSTPDFTVTTSADFSSPARMKISDLSLNSGASVTQMTWSSRNKSVINVLITFRYMDNQGDTYDKVYSHPISLLESPPAIQTKETPLTHNYATTSVSPDWSTSSGFVDGIVTFSHGIQDGNGGWYTSTTGMLVDSSNSWSQTGGAHYEDHNDTVDSSFVRSDPSLDEVERSWIIAPGAIKNSSGTAVSYKIVSMTGRIEANFAAATVSKVAWAGTPAAGVHFYKYTMDSAYLASETKELKFVDSVTFGNGTYTEFPISLASSGQHINRLEMNTSHTIAEDEGLMVFSALKRDATFPEPYPDAGVIRYFLEISVMPDEA